MADDMIDNPETLCRRLAEACGAAGLTADQLGPTRVRVGVTGAGMLAEVIRCMPGSDEALYWYWSWDEPICPAADISRATRMIAYVVTPANA
jgi:hypothetical protein